MEFDIKERCILRLFREGLIYRHVAETFRISREVITGKMKRNPEFAAAVKLAREKGRANREHGIWFRHPRRGMRPPTGKGHGGKPRFGVKRRA